MERNSKEGLYFISVAARLAEVHPQTLRIYERKGLVRPKRTPKNRRCYSDADIRRLKRIQELTQGKGLNLSGVRMVLQLENEMEDLRRKVAGMEKEVSEVRRQMVEEIEGLKKRVALSKKSPTNIAIRTRRAFSK